MNKTTDYLKEFADSIDVETLAKIERIFSAYRYLMITEGKLKVGDNWRKVDE